jgi:predicted enzyme related to lactoylglutathione lyase
VCLDDQGRAVAGIGLAGDALPHWLVSFAVNDVEAAADAARAAGGKVLASATGGAHRRHVTLADPAGARFGVLETG